MVLPRLKSYAKIQTKEALQQEVTCVAFQLVDYLNAFSNAFFFFLNILKYSVSTCFNVLFPWH